jgi:hypothetical protein
MKVAPHPSRPPRPKRTPAADVDVSGSGGGGAWTLAAALAVCLLIFGVRRTLRPLPPDPPPPRAIPAEIAYTRPYPDAEHGTIAMVLCRYTIDGRRYGGYAPARATAGPQPVEAIRAKFPVGGTVMIYASPADPRKPLLEPPPPRASPARRARLGRFVLLLGCALASGWIGRALSIDEARRPRPGSRGLHAVPPPVVEVYEFNTRRLAGLLIVAAAVVIAVAGSVHYFFF